jgi:short subunit dehydrogenase-like uncharacterized protein
MPVLVVVVDTSQEQGDDPQLQRLVRLWSHFNDLRSLPLEPGLAEKDETFWRAFLAALPTTISTTSIMAASLNALYQLERKCPLEYQDWLRRCGTTVESLASTTRPAIMAASTVDDDENPAAATAAAPIEEEPSSSSLTKIDATTSTTSTALEVQKDSTTESNVATVGAMETNVTTATDTWSSGTAATTTSEQATTTPSSAPVDVVNADDQGKIEKDKEENSDSTEEPVLIGDVQEEEEEPIVMVDTKQMVAPLSLSSSSVPPASQDILSTLFPAETETEVILVDEEEAVEEPADETSQGILPSSLLADTEELPIIQPHIAESPPPGAATSSWSDEAAVVTATTTTTTTMDRLYPSGSADHDNAIPVSSTSSLKSADSSSVGGGLDNAASSSITIPFKLAGNPAIIAPSFSEIIQKTSLVAPSAAKSTSSLPETAGASSSSKQNIGVVKRSEPKTKFVPSLSAVVSVGGDNAKLLKTAADENHDSFDGARVVVLTTSAPSHEEITRQQTIVADALREENVDDIMIVDGKDKASKGKQKALFHLSGSYGEYPQVFNRDSKGNLSFWGNFESFLKSKKRGTLVSELLHGKMSVDDDRRDDKSLLVLVSNQSLKQEVKVRQKQALSILDARGIQYDTLDGADPINKGRRTELIALSGHTGQYPQFFVIGPNSSVSYWGDWDFFEAANESGSLTKEFGADGPVGVVDRTIGSGPESPIELDGKLVCLISGQSIDRDVGLKQEKSLRIFTDKSIAYETIDGADPTNKKLRGKLFAISGLRATYPQFFLLKNNEYTFIGDWEKLETCNETSAMAKFFLPVVKPAPTNEQPKAADAEEKSLDKPPSKSEQPVSVKRNLSTQSTPVMDNLSHGSTDAVDAAAAAAPKHVSWSSTAKNSSVPSEITFYGATSFVAKHALDYMMQVSLTLPGVRKITLAGRSFAKIESLRKTLTYKMANLKTLHPDALGRCSFDTVIADSSDVEGLVAMASKTKVVVCFAGPFAKYSENVVAACAKTGTDYVDITGEVSWSSTMRLKYSSLAEASGARIISFCGFDSVPSDLAIYAAAENMKRKLGRSTVISCGTTWHYAVGAANGGTIQTVVDMPLNIGRCLFRAVPFLLDDPLALTHPRVRLDEKNNERKNRLAKAEWMNQLVFFEYFLGLGWSAPFFMAPVNTKVVNASAVALEYGPDFVYYERYLPVGFRMTKAQSLLSLVPALIVQFGVLWIGFVLKFPILGKIIASIFFPAGSGMSDQMCSKGLSEVYAEVATPEKNGKIDRVYCALRFEGDPGNWVTAQCVCESALGLVLDRSKLPKRSADGFGTPAELLGSVLLNRLETTKVRPVEVKTYMQKNAGPNDRVLCHFE